MCVVYSKLQQSTTRDGLSDSNGDKAAIYNIHDNKIKASNIFSPRITLKNWHAYIKIPVGGAKRQFNVSKHALSTTEIFLHQNTQK